jgi:ABC-2 type transport system permease protein
MINPFWIVWHSAAVAYADFRAIYTVRSWTFGWLGRMLAQVTFFTGAGYALGRTDQLAYLAIGNAVMTSVIESMMVIASTCWERETGTLPLLAAVPGNLGWIFVGRSLQWPLSGTATSVVALFALCPFFGVTWDPIQVGPVILLVVVNAVATYCFGLLIGSFVLAAPGLRNIASNVAYLAMMAVCGVVVPIGSWPTAIRPLAYLLPLTYGLKAIRAVHGNAPAGHVLALAIATAAIGTAYLGLALVSFRFFHGRTRRQATLGFTS